MDAAAGDGSLHIICHRRWQSASYLPPVMAVCILFAAGDGSLHLICRSLAADKNIFKDGIHGECKLIFLDAVSNVTPSYDTNFFLLLDAVTNEKTEIDSTLHNFQHYYSVLVIVNLK